MLKKDYSQYKWEILFISSIVLFMVGYGLLFNQILINDDSLPRVYIGRTYAQGSGRPLGVFLTNTLVYGINNPIVTSILTWFTLLISSIYTIKLFDIKHLRTMLAIAASYYTFPLFGIYWRFGTDMWLYTLVCAVSIYAMYNILKNDRPWLGVISIVLSLAIYQGEIGILAMLFSAYYIEQIINEDFVQKELFKTIGLVALSFLTYYLLLKGITSLSTLDMNSYKGADEIGIKQIFSNLSLNISNSYKTYFRFITGNLTYFDYFHTPIIWIFINLILPVYILISLLYLRVKNLTSQIWLMILFVTIPIAMNLQQLVTSDYMTRTYFGSLILIIYLVIIIFEKLQLNEMVSITIVGIIIFMNLNSLNSIELAALKLQEENLKVGNQILMDLRAFPGYQTGAEVATCGNFVDNDNYNYPRIYPYVFGHETFTDMHGVTYNFFMTYPNDNQYGITLSTRLFEYLGEEVNMVYNDCDSSQPSFPEDGYIYEDNNVININFGS